MHKTLGKFTAGLALAIGLSGFGAAAFAQEPIKLTISAFTTSNSPNHRLTIDRFIEEVEAGSNGKVKFETYFGGSAYGNAPRQYDQVQRDLVDISHGMFGYTPGRFPMADLIELPFLFEDSVAASKAFWVTQQKYLSDSFPGVRPIAIWLTSMQQLQSRAPVNSIDDMSGLKIRAGGPIMVDTLAALGSEGILTPAPGVYEAMEKGVLDGAVGAWGMLRAFNVGEVSSYHLGINVSAAPLFLMMNQKKYDSLPDDVKALIDGFSTPETIGSFAAAFARSDGAGLEIAQSEGHTMRTLSKDERAQWRARVQPVIDAHVAELEAKGLPAKAFIADFTAEYNRQLAAAK